MKVKVVSKSCSAYLTVYFALLISVLLSLWLALIEGVRSNAIQVEAECITDISLNSILAEYHRELFSQYNLLAIDSSYGTVNVGVDGMEQHLEGYLNRNMSMEAVFLSDFFYKDFLAMMADEVEMTGASIMTDGNGRVFRKCAVEAMKDDCNLTLLQNLQQWTQVIEDNGLRERDVAAEKQRVDAQIQEYNGRKIQISETEWSTVQIENPTDQLEQIRKTGILNNVVEDVNNLSTKGIRDELLIKERMKQEQVNKGNIQAEEGLESEQLLERFFFQEYLMSYLGHYNAEKENGALSYQIEYLLAEKDTDIENLKQVANTICAIREAANVLYLYTDEEKCAAAEVAATLVSSLLLIPEATPLFKTAILLGWAYAESLYDVEVLLSGGSVPLIKDEETWHYDLQNALRLTSNVENTGAERGLCYEDYLRVLMMFTDLDTLTGRAMNMVEADIRLTPGNTYFRLDNCFEQVEFRIRVNSEYGYHYEITRKKGY